MPLPTRRAALAAGLALALPPLAAHAADKAPPVVEFRRAEKTAAPGLTEATVAGGKEKVYLHKAADLTAADVASAQVAADGSIEVTFTAAGAKKAAKVSEEHADKPLAVVAGGKVFAAPVLRAKLGAAVRITGEFSRDEAAAVVKALTGK